MEVGKRYLVRGMVALVNIDAGDDNLIPVFMRMDFSAGRLGTFIGLQYVDQFDDYLYLFSMKSENEIAIFPCFKDQVVQEEQDGQY